jgi:hypothetical protein
MKLPQLLADEEVGVIFGLADHHLEPGLPFARALASLASA